MSDIQEEQKRLYKRAEENDVKLLQEENKRLNNIIDELEKWAEDYRFADILKNKLNELKGDNK